MPELPEVETTVRGLSRVLPNLTIRDVWTDWEKLFRGADFAPVRKTLRGKKVAAVGRRGKNIIIVLDNGKSLLVHMKMTGHLLYGKYKKEKNKWMPAQKGALNDPFNRFVHVVIILSNGKHLAFSDTRKFGKLWIEKTDHLPHSPHLAHLGPEPLDTLFTKKIMRERILKRPKSKIKSVLMDQSVIAGIGNIYSDEILWRSDIHPERPPSSITEKEWAILFKNTIILLRKGISLGGDSMSDYRNIHGERGKFQLEHKAYQKTGKPCGKRGCGGVIIRKMIGGRSSHFCSLHQK